MKFFVVDAFTSKPFEGGPAGVFFLQEFLSDELLQRITSELNHANSAFLVPLKDDPDPWVNSNRFAVRWFARNNEVFLCGHATLAAGHVLFSIGNKAKELIFEPTSVDPLIIKKGKDNRVILDFPQNMPFPLTPLQEEGFGPLIQELCGDFKVVETLLFGDPVKKLLVRVDDNVTRNDIESLKVSPARLAELHPKTSEFAGIIITTKGELSSEKPGSTSREQHHFYSRYFAPWNGIPEDPACGSAHTLLGPYWSSRLGLKQLKCRQCSPRGAEMVITIKEDGRLEISGKAVTILHGEMHLQTISTGRNLLNS